MKRCHIGRNTYSIMRIHWDRVRDRLVDGRRRGESPCHIQSSRENRSSHRRKKDGQPIKKVLKGVISITNHFPATHPNISPPSPSLQPAAMKRVCRGEIYISRSLTLFAITLTRLNNSTYKKSPVSYPTENLHVHCFFAIT